MNSIISTYLPHLADDIDIDPVTGCWLWNKSCRSTGYGQKFIGGVNYLMHRYMYMWWNQCDIPEGLVIRHMCHTPRCCNPQHLQCGTNADNYDDSRHIHYAAQEKFRRATGWVILGVKYPTMREASISTGIGMSALLKHTRSDGVFDYSAYLNGCSIGNIVPGPERLSLI